MPPRKCAIYARVSTKSQTVENQLLELRAVAARQNWQIAAEVTDAGLSGAKGRSDRPGFDRLFHMIRRNEIDIVLCWSIDRLGRSITDLVSFMKELEGSRIDLYCHQQGLNTTTPAGRMVYGIFASLGEYERELIRERINAGLKRARSEGKKLGRPSVATQPAVINSVKLLRSKGMSIHNIAKNLRIGVGTASKILSAA
jgi:DNA invertase Pin-like site-specific DNA recombinase